MSQVVTVDDLRKEIPPHCFRPSYSTSFAYLCRDFMVAGALFYSAWAFIPHIEYQLARYAGWALYGYIQGLAWTGIWVRVCGLDEPAALTESCGRFSDTSLKTYGFLSFT